MSGEIALRFIRTARRLGIETISVIPTKKGWPLSCSRRTTACKVTQPILTLRRIRSSLLQRAFAADAIAPGYGPLAENADFAATCRDQWLNFIGPIPTHCC